MAAERLDVTAAGFWDTPPADPEVFVDPWSLFGDGPGPTGVEFASAGAYVLTRLEPMVTPSADVLSVAWRFLGEDLGTVWAIEVINGADVTVATATITVTADFTYLTGTLTPTGTVADLAAALADTNTRVGATLVDRGEVAITSAFYEFCLEVTAAGVTVAPPCRLYPRTDNLGNTPRNYPRPDTRQRSPRNTGTL